MGHFFHFSSFWLKIYSKLNWKFSINIFIVWCTYKLTCLNGCSEQLHQVFTVLGMYHGDPTTNLHFRSWLQKSSKSSILQSKRAAKKRLFWSWINFTLHHNFLTLIGMSQGGFTQLIIFWMGFVNWIFI